MQNQLDIERLAALVRTKRANRGLREVAAEIGAVSPSTLSRVENGRTPDMETFLQLCDWLEIAPAELFRLADTPAPTETPAERISLQLRADRNLDPATANVLAALVKAAYRDLSREKEGREKKEGGEKREEG